MPNISKIRSDVSGSTTLFSSVTDTRIFELLPGGTPQSEIDSFFVQYEQIKEDIQPGTIPTNIIYNELSSSLNKTFQTGSFIRNLVEQIQTIEKSKTHAYLISEGNVLTNGQYPIYSLTDYTNIVNILNIESYKNDALNQSITASLVVLDEFNAAMRLLQTQFDDFNNTVLGLSAGLENKAGAAERAVGIMSQTSAASINKSITLASLFFSRLEEISKAFTIGINGNYNEYYTAALPYHEENESDGRSEPSDTGNDDTESDDGGTGDTGTGTEENIPDNNIEPDTNIERISDRLSDERNQFVGGNIDRERGD